MNGRYSKASFPEFFRHKFNFSASVTKDNSLGDVEGVVEVTKGVEFPGFWGGMLVRMKGY